MVDGRDALNLLTLITFAPVVIKIYGVIVPMVPWPLRSYNPIIHLSSGEVWLALK